MASPHTSARTPPTPSVESPAPDPALMAIRLPVPGWFGPVCLALKHVLASPPKEANLFRRVLAHAARYGGDIANRASEGHVSRERDVESYPLASFLLALPVKPRPIQITLAWITLEAHLARSHERLVLRLSRISRGLAQSDKSKLWNTVAECNGPSELLAKMARLARHDTSLGVTGHQTFDAVWRDELHAFCISLVSTAQSPAGDLGGTTDSIDQPGPLTENPAGQGGEDADEHMFLPAGAIASDGPIRGRKRRQALDWSVHMSRQSSPDLLRPAEGILPQGIRECSWHLAVRDADVALNVGDISEAACKLATILSIEAGLAAREVVEVGFGSVTVSKIPVIDLAAKALRRAEILPPGYFLPDSHDDRWLATGGDVIFPLSAECCALAQRLVDARTRRFGSDLPSSLLSDGVEPSQLRAAVRSEHRLVLAVHLADEIGVDAAQRAFGDTFGLSTAPMFYGTYHAQDIVRVLLSANHFAHPDQTSAPWSRAADHWLGSRVRPTHTPYRDVWTKLQGTTKRPRGRPSTLSSTLEWRHRRNRLAVHFLLATGHRPSNAVSRLTLHDFLPRHALAVVSDKVADPAHATRLVCTGWRFVGELESFVIELQRICRSDGPAEARRLASEILRGEAPLFSVPVDGATETVDIRALLADLDPLWGFRPNLHRHGLCQFLLRQKIDPELRFFQMGWLLHEHHATSASAPFPPTRLGVDLAEVVDRWLDECEWLGGAVPIHPADLIPSCPLVDWDSRRAAVAKAAREQVDGIRAQIKEAGRALKRQIWRNIQEVAAQTLPDFDASGDADRPSFVPRGGVANTPESPLVITQHQVGRLLAPFQDARYTPAERRVAARLVRKALLRGAKSRGIRVFVPTVPVLSAHRVQSPFLPGAGLALAQMDALHAALVDNLACPVDAAKQQALRELAATALWSILLHTPCRDAEDALAILRAAGEARHAGAEPWLLRVPFRKGHVTLNGDEAALVGRLLGYPDWNAELDAVSKNSFSFAGTFIKKVLPALCPPDMNAQSVVRRVVETAIVAKALTLNGADRLILSGAVSPVSVTAERAASIADGVTIPDASAAPRQGSRVQRAPVPAAHSSSGRSRRDLARVMAPFNPDFTGDIGGVRALPPEERRHQLKPLLEEALSQAGDTPTVVRLILEYAWHLLVQGGPRSSGGQAISTISKTYHHIEPVLRSLGEGESLARMTVVDLTAICRQACQASKRKSSFEVLESLRRFFKYAATNYPIATPNWGVLYQAYGVPCAGGDPAIIGDAEAARIIERFAADVKALDGSDADPAERRYREVRLIAALLAEASAARPRSIHGLTFADVVLGADRDYIHLKARGPFASIKTPTAAGYIPLDGPIWANHLPWFSAWFGRACAGLATADLDAIPLFQIPGQPIGVRFEMPSIFGPLHEMVRWATQQPRGRTYWFRKRRVRARHLEVHAMRHPRALDIARVLRFDGQALLMTPLAWYLSEPSAYGTRDLSRHVINTRLGAVAVTGLGIRQVDGVARFAPPGSPINHGRLLRLGPAKWPAAHYGDCPTLPGYNGDLQWSSVERILRDLAHGHDVGWISAGHGIPIAQAESAAEAARALVARLQVPLGVGDTKLAPPRYTERASGWYKLLAKQDERLSCVAQDWLNIAPAAGISEGCWLFDQRAIGLLRTIASDLDVPVEASEPDVLGRTLVRFAPEGGRSYGIWRTVRWLLAAVWVASFRAQRYLSYATHRESASA